MAERSLVELLEERINTRAQRMGDAAPTAPAPSSPVDTLEERIALRQQRIARAAELKRRKMESYEESWIGQMGADPDSIVGYGLNAGVDVTTRAMLGAGRIAATPFETSAMGQVDAVTGDQLEAYARLRGQRRNAEAQEALQPDGAQSGQVDLAGLPEAGAYTEADAATLAERAPAPLDDLPANHPRRQAQQSDLARRQAPTALERLESAAKAREVAAGIREAADVTELAYDGYRQKMDRDLLDDVDTSLTQAGEALSGLAKGEVADNLPAFLESAASLLANTGRAFKDNPKGFGQMVMQEVSEDIAPALLIPGGAGKALMHTDNIGIGVQAYNDGIENFLADEGRAPTAEEKQYMAQQAMLSVAANSLGDMSLIKFGRLAPSQGAAKAISDVIAPTGKLARATTVGAATEGLQTHAEGEARHRPASAEDIYYAMSTGAGVSGAGATPSTAVETLETIGSTTRQALAARDKRNQVSDSEAVQQARTQAEESGDVSALIDPEQPSYSPKAAMETLVKRHQNSELSAEDRQAAQDKASEVLGTLETEVGALREAAETTTDQMQARWQAVLDKKQAELEALPDDAEASERQALEETIQAAQDNLTFLAEENETLEAGRKQTQARLQRAERQLRELTEMRDGMQRQAIKPEEIQARVTAASEGDAEAASEVLRLAIESPDLLDPSEVQRVADNADNGLSQGQRDFLARFSEARQAEHALKGVEGVTTDVFQGSEEYVGINQYRSRYNDQVKAGNEARARAQLQGIEAFAQQREEKLAAAQAALDEINASNGETKRIDLTYTPENGWQKAGRFLNADERAKAGALVVTRGTTRLLDTLAMEAEAVRAAADELAAAEALRQEDVIATTQQGNTESVQEQETADDATEATADAEPAAEGSQPEAVQDRAAEPEPEPAPTADGAVDESTEQAPVDEEATADESPEAGAEVDEATGQEYDPVTGEVIEETPTQNRDPESRGEGGLSVLASAVKRASGTLGDQAFRAANLVREYVRQDQRDLALRVTRRPLVEVRNFLTQLARDESLAQQFVTGELTDEQRALVADISVKLRRLNEDVRNSLPEWNPDHQPYFHQDFIQFFRDPATGELDENTLTAISLAAYSWVGENAKKQVNDNKAINRILGRQTKKPVGPEEAAALREIGQRQNRVINDLGRRAAESLGLTVDNGVPQNIMPQIHGALGGRALAVLRDRGLVKVEHLTAQKMAELRNEKLDPRYNRVKHYFVKVPQGHVEANAITQKLSGTQSLVSKLFGVEDRRPSPSLKRVPFKATTTKRTTMEIPQALKRILTAENAKAHYVREDMLGLWSRLDRATRLTIAGGVDPDNRWLHKSNRKGVDGKNEGLVREIESFDEFVDELRAGEQGLMAPFYLDREVWKMQRVGLKNSKVNPQASKIHRHLVKMGGWEHTVRLDNSDGSLDAFQLAVADALGIKTDSQSNEASLEEVRTKIADPAIEAGVVAIMKGLNNESLNEADQAAITAAVNEGGEAMHSLDGLVALAHWRRAEGQATFTHTLTREVDGKTNGPMLGQWLLGAANNARELLDMTIRGGFFTAADGVEHIGEWAANKANLDLYQKVAKRLTELAALSQQQDPTKSQVYAALYFFTGDLADQAGRVTKYGRNFVKTPVTALQFGSATKTVVDDMGNELIQMIHDRIEKVANIQDPEERRTEHKALVRNMRVLLGNQMPQGGLMDFEIRGQAAEALRERFLATLGGDIEATMDEVFAPVIARRRPVNEAAGAAFALYNAAYQHARHAYLQELRQEGELAGKLNGKTLEYLEDLSPEQEAEVASRVAAILPRVHTPFSKQEGNLDAGLFLGKSEMKSDKGEAYGNTTKLPKGRQNLTSGGDRRMLENPGVGALIWMIHSSDSYIAASTYAGHQALNVHDALIAGLGEIEGTARDLNRHTLEMLVEYSPATEVAEALERTLVAYNAYLAENGLENSPVMRDLLTPNLKVDPEKVLETVRQTAQEADRVKLEALAQLEFVSQYTLEGGQYQVTAEDRQRINELLGVETTAEPLSDAEMDQLRELLAKADEAPASEPAFAEPDPAELESTIEDSPYSEVADGREDSTDDYANESIEPEPVSDTMLGKLRAAAQLGAKPLTVDELIEIGLEGASPATRTVLEKLRGHPGVEATTVWITDVGMGHTPGHVTRNQTTGKQDLTVDVGFIDKLEARNPGSSEATYSEVIAHELLHAATMATLDAKTPYAERLRGRMSEIQRDLKAWMQANPQRVATLDRGTRRNLETMTQNLHEVATYGLTAARVQAVLRDIPSRKGPGSAWSRFVLAMRELLRLPARDATLLDEVLVASEQAIDAREDTDQGNTVTLEVENADDPDGPMRYTTRQIYDSLDGEADPALDRLLERVVDGLHGPFGAFKERARVAEAVGPEDVFLKALAKGQAPFVSQSRVAGFGLTDKQAFVLEQVEATLRASMEMGGTNDLARRELNKVWKEAKAQLDTAGWLTDQQKAFLFEMQSADQDHLARFAALAMVYPPLRERMDFTTARQQVRGREASLSERLMDLFKRILELFHGRLTKTFAGQQADDKVWTLMDQLVDIEARRRARLQDQSVTWKDQVEEKIEGVSEGIRENVVKFGRSDFIQGRRNAFVKAGGNIAAVVAGDRVDELFNHIEQVRNRMFEKRQGMLAGLISEARGAHDKATQRMHQLLRQVAKRNEQERLRLIDLTRQTVLESFSDNGKNLSKEQKKALTRVLLDTDMAVLMDRYSQEELTGLAASQKTRQQAIEALEGELKALNSPWIEYYLGAGKELGHHMATGEVTGPNLMLNAHNIASMYGTKYRNRVSDAEIEAAREILDPLISLYALDYTDQGLRESVVEVMRAETARGNASGVLNVLMFHKRMQQEAQAKLFQGNPVQMQKGYRTEIYNPYKSVTTAPLADEDSYLAMGYKRVSLLPLDPNDPDQVQKAMYVMPDGGLARRLTGVVSYTNESMRGSGIHGGVSSVSSNGRFRNNERKNQEILAEREAAIDALVKHGSRHDPRQATKKSYLAPTLNAQGDVVNYRYLMQQDVKDAVLDRNNAVDDVLGGMAGHAFDKVASKEQNRLAVRALKEQFDAEYAEQPSSYVRIAADSEDKELAETWKLLPDDAKQAVKEIWGGQEMRVRVDLVDVTFGYQKPSLGTMFKKDPEERRGIEKLVAGFWEMVLGKKAYLRVRQAENAWIEIVKELKDILVVKTGLTLLGNVLSNVSLLIWHGVPVTDLARDHRVALEGVMHYRRDHNELVKLQQLRDAGRAQNPKAVDQRIRELQDALKHNPVAFMIDEGLMPTIVEDVDLHDDPYSYKSQLAEKAEAWTGKVWKPARVAGKYLYMTHDTPLYKALSQGTQVSDFVARYTLYQHLTTRKRKRMNHADAIQRSSDMFINYDVPTHRMVQYLNDVGLLMFTKYYIRIQRAILTLYRENPARAMLVTALDTLMPGLATLADSQAWDRIGNPFEPGALGYPGVLDELATVKAGLSPFN